MWFLATHSFNRVVISLLKIEFLKNFSIFRSQSFTSSCKCLFMTSIWCFLIWIVTLKGQQFNLIPQFTHFFANSLSNLLSCLSWNLGLIVEFTCNELVISRVRGHLRLKVQVKVGSDVMGRKNKVTLWHIGLFFLGHCQNLLFYLRIRFVIVDTIAHFLGTFKRHLMQLLLVGVKQNFRLIVQFWHK